MRVLMFSWEYPPHMVGGLGRHVAELLPELVDEDVEVHLITPRLKGDKEEDALLSAASGAAAQNGSRVYRVDTSFEEHGNFYNNCVAANIALGAAASDVINSVGDFDLIHAHDWLVSFAAIGIKQHRHIPLISTIHATETGRNRGHLWEELQRNIHTAEWRLSYESWRLIAASGFMSWELQTYFNAPAHKIDVISNAIDTTAFDRLKRGELLGYRDRWARRDEKIVFYVGRLVWEKGLQVLVDAVPEVVSHYPNVKFIVAGGGDFRFDLARRAAARGVGDWFSFPGRISDEDRDMIYTVADCAVFPSLYEPFGIVALEAMAAGCPVVVSDVGGLAEVVESHETGLKAQPDNPHSLAWAILDTLQHPDWAAARAVNAVQVAKQIYNWDRVAKMTSATYARVAEEAQNSDWAYNGSRKSASRDGVGPAAELALADGRSEQAPEQARSRMER